MASTPFDQESSRWLEELRSPPGPVRDKAVGRLHDLLLRVARSEANRRRGSLSDDIRGELEDFCHQAANDAAVAVLHKLDTFRGASRFTTWACKFVILELSVRLRKRAWSSRRVAFDEAAWERVVDPAGDIAASLQEPEILGIVRKGIEETLTEHQRSVFLAAVVQQVPIDVIAERLGSSRGAVYKVVHDARRKLRQALTTAGYLGEAP